MNMIAGYTIQIQSLNHKIKSMDLERININISKRFGLAGNLRRVNEDDNTIYNLKDIKQTLATSVLSSYTKSNGLNLCNMCN